jgi:hypothetical protein
MHRDVALAGGAVLAAGLLLGYIADRLTRNSGGPKVQRVAPVRARGRSALREKALAATDVLERYRVAAAF